MVEISQFKLRLGRWLVILKPPNPKPPNSNARQKRRRVRWGLLTLLAALVIGLYRLGVAAGAAGFLLRMLDYVRSLAEPAGVIVSAAAAVLVSAVIILGRIRYV
jgi:hypothetical protein